MPRHPPPLPRSSRHLPLRPLPPSRLLPTLQRRLSDADRVAVLGVGSELRGDDAAGTLVARQLAAAVGRSRRVASFVGYTAPENFTGPIVRHLRGAAEGRRALVLVDAAELGRRAGTIILLEAKDLAGVTFSTHQLPLALLVDYIVRSVPVRVFALAVQPASTAFGAPVSPAVRRAVTRLVSALRASAVRR